MKSWDRSWRAMVIVMLGVLLVGCISSAATPTALPTTAPTAAQSVVANTAPTQANAAPTNSAKPWPTHGWQTASPAEQGMDAAKLEAMVQAVEERRINLQSLLVVRNGYIVSETYFGQNTPDTTYHLFSVTKSFVATLVGISVDTGALPDIELPMLDMLGRTPPEPNKNLQAMRVKDLLTMRTGWMWTESDASYDAMYRSDDWVDFMLRLPAREQPDRRFVYCSGCSHVLAAIVEERTQTPLYTFAQQKLFAPLGIQSPRWDEDSQGIPIGGWGLWLTPRDMAKFGYLYLNNGEWDGQQIVSADWVAESTRLQTRTGGSLDYGYQWWIAERMKGYAAMGRYGQTILVLPEQQMVVVATARIDTHDPIFNLAEEFVIPAVQ